MPKMNKLAPDLSVGGRYDVDTGEYRIRHSQPIEPFKKAAALRREMDDAGMLNRKKDIYRVASIPMVIVMKIKDEHHIDATNLRTQAEKAKLLAIIDSEYPELRTVSGRLSASKRNVRRVTS